MNPPAVPSTVPQRCKVWEHSGGHMLWLMPLSVGQGPTRCLANTCDGIVTRCGIY